MSRQPSPERTVSPVRSEDFNVVLDKTPQSPDSKMNDDKYKEAIGSLKRQLRAARRAIGGYTPADVRLVDRDTFHVTLAEIKVTVNSVVDQMDEFTDRLEDAGNADR